MARMISARVRVATGSGGGGEGCTDAVGAEGAEETCAGTCDGNGCTVAAVAGAGDIAEAAGAPADEGGIDDGAEVTGAGAVFAGAGARGTLACAKLIAFNEFAGAACGVAGVVTGAVLRGSACTRPVAGGP